MSDFDFMFENFLNRLVNESINKIEIADWIEEVADEITRIAVELDDDELIETILLDNSFNSSLFSEWNETLVRMFQEKYDTEKAAYAILNIMIKNKK